MPSSRAAKAGTGEPSTEPPVAPPAVQKIEAEAARAMLADIVSSVETIRGLRFKTPVPMKVVGDADMRQHVLDRLAELQTKDELKVQETAYRLLGLIPADFDLLATMLDVLEEQVGGYYDPKTRTFYLLDDMPASAAPVLMAHELTHALEDQHFDLDRRIKSAKLNEDLLFAHTAVHEGSAVLVMGVFMVKALAEGRLKMEDLQAFAETEAGRGEKLSNLPPVLRRPLLGAYLLGAAFFSKGSGGSTTGTSYPAAQVDRAYREGPTSSEQILHPEAYWSRKDVPRTVELSRAGSVLGGGFKRTGDGILGELILGVLVDAPMPSDLATAALTGPGAWTNAAATGWGGDRWELWQSGARSVATLTTVWDTDTDAQEFASALHADGGLAWRREGNRVALVAGDVADRATSLLRVLLGLPAGEVAPKRSR